MNLQLGAEHDPRAPYNQPSNVDSPWCDECEEEMQIFDTFEYRRGIIITEWKCPVCGKIESNEPFES